MSAGRALELGYRRVYVMGEGVRGWAARGLPLESARGASGAVGEVA